MTAINVGTWKSSACFSGPVPDSLTLSNPSMPVAVMPAQFFLYPRQGVSPSGSYLVHSYCKQIPHILYEPPEFAHNVDGTASQSSTGYEEGGPIFTKWKCRSQSPCGCFKWQEDRLLQGYVVTISICTALS